VDAAALRGGITTGEAAILSAGKTSHALNRCCLFWLYELLSIERSTDRTAWPGLLSVAEAVRHAIITCIIGCPYAQSCLWCETLYDQGSTDPLPQCTFSGGQDVRVCKPSCIHNLPTLSAGQSAAERASANGRGVSAGDRQAGDPGASLPA